MFLDKYLNETYVNLLYDKYDEDYIREIDENNFIDIYNLFKEYNFYFIEDIIINYLELFMCDREFINDGVLKLREKLGDNFVYHIGNNLLYLDDILND